MLPPQDVFYVNIPIFLSLPCGGGWYSHGPLRLRGLVSHVDCFELVYYQPVRVVIQSNKNRWETVNWLPRYCISSSTATRILTITRIMYRLKCSANSATVFACCTDQGPDGSLHHHNYMTGSFSLHSGAPSSGAGDGSGDSIYANMSLRQLNDPKCLPEEDAYELCWLLRHEFATTRRSKMPAWGRCLLKSYTGCQEKVLQEQEATFSQPIQLTESLNPAASVCVHPHLQTCIHVHTILDKDTYCKLYWP